MRRSSNDRRMRARSPCNSSSLRHAVAACPCRRPGRSQRAIIDSKITRNDAAMEAEQINLIANTLVGVDTRTAELRRYL